MGIFEVIETKQILFSGQAEKLFNMSARADAPGKQQLIPFLGAGVSLSGRAWPAPAAAPAQVDTAAAKVDELCDQLGLDATNARDFIKLAVYIASQLQTDVDEKVKWDHQQLYEELRQDDYPPSVGQLTTYLSLEAKHTKFETVVQDLARTLPPGYLPTDSDAQIKLLRLLAAVTGIANPPDPLTGIASYYEQRLTREYLWMKLHGIFSGKEKATNTHRLIAAAASRHIQQRFTDYLIVTSNYDCLMEKALDEAGVKYVVLATRKKDQKVVVRFSPNVEMANLWVDLNSGQYHPKNWSLVKPGESLVVLYKIHGCLNPDLKFQDDSVIISDSDYIDYLSHMETYGAVPSWFNTNMHGKAFLFLGYSLSDWNVRSLFETLRRKRGEDFGGQDYAVMNWVGEYEKVFFRKNLITILQTDLNAYVAGVAADLKGRSQTDEQHIAQTALKIIYPDEMAGGPGTSSDD
ncbi:MAG TPA: SIR2 family protein [Pyrinomonadaceae bacterium]|jgi:hypothetical protein